MKPRPMYYPPSFWRTFNRDTLTAVLSIVAGLVVSLFLLGFIRP